MDEDANSAIHHMREAHWIVESLAVAPECKGRGNGSSMLQNCIIPYVRQHDGKKIVLITNSENNSRFSKRMASGKPKAISYRAARSMW